MAPSWRRSFRILYFLRLLVIRHGGFIPNNDSVVVIASTIAVVNTIRVASNILEANNIVIINTILVINTIW